MRRPGINVGRAAAFLCLMSAGAARADGAFPNSQNILTPPALPHEILLGTNFGVVMSFDDGRSWTWTCEQELTAFATLYQLSAPPQNRLLAISPMGVIRSDDVGCTWASATGVAAGTASDVFADPTNPDRVLAVATLAGDGGTTSDVRLSTDGGRSFPTSIYTTATGDHVSGVEIARSAPQIVYLTLTSGAAFTPQVAQSTDGGAHWTVHDLSADLPDKSYSISLVAVDPLEAQKVYLRVRNSSSEALAVSTDGGASAKLPLLLPDGALTAFARMDSGSLIAAGILGTQNVAYRSTDGGASFQMLPTALPLRALSARGTTLFAATDTMTVDSAVETSPDEGVTWNPLMAYQDIQAIQTCVMAACQTDCLNRADMSQWPEEMCSATAPQQIVDAGAAGRDAGGPTVPPSRGGCRCQAATGGPGSVDVLLGVAILAEVVRRRRRPRRPGRVAT